MALLVGLEPTTTRLTVVCSTDWAKEAPVSKSLLHSFWKSTYSRYINNSCELFTKDWQVPILPKGCPLSTFSVCELNFQVRNVTGCTLTAILTNHLFNFILFSFFPLCLGHSKLHSNNLRLRFRLISIGPLNELLHLHSQPIKLLVSKLSVEYLS